MPDTLEARHKFLHQVYILDPEDGKLSRQPVLGDGGEAEAERECTAPKSSQGAGECGAGSEQREEGLTFSKTRRTPKAALGRKRMNWGSNSDSCQSRNSKPSRQVGGASNQRPLPKAGFYMPGWADHF